MTSQNIVSATRAGNHVTVGAAPNEVRQLITALVTLIFTIISLPLIMVTFVILHHFPYNSCDLLLSRRARRLRISSSNLVGTVEEAILFPLQENPVSFSDPQNLSSN